LLYTATLEQRPVLLYLLLELLSPHAADRAGGLARTKWDSRQFLPGRRAASSHGSRAAAAMRYGAMPARSSAAANVARPCTSWRLSLPA
jgi:hypothetical protein